MASYSTYLPSKDGDLLVFATNMNTKIAVDPAAWGLDLGQQGSFQTLVTTFSNAMAVIQDPDQKTTPNVTAKNDARELLINSTNGIRKLVDIIQAYPGTTNSMRDQINITIRDTTPTPVPAPSTKPVITLTGVDDNTIYFYLRDFADPDRRGKPEGVASAYIVTWVGDDPPQDFSAWTVGKAVTKTTDSVTVPVASAPLSKVWIAAAWMNAKAQTGPFSTAVWTNLGGGVAAQAA
ncbi:MAG: hypothetical protein ACR2GY_08280 [Phycisphaerales bacterium]